MPRLKATESPITACPADDSCGDTSPVGYEADAGACGTLLRYGLAGVPQRASDGEFPWGTAAVNAAGYFLAGVFWSYTQNRVNISGEMPAAMVWL